MNESWTAEALGITRTATKPKPSRLRLTTAQRTVLDALRTGASFTPYGLSQILDTSPEGAASTASSLVRRGLAKRVKGDRGRVMYRRA